MMGCSARVAEVVSAPAAGFFTMMTVPFSNHHARELSTISVAVPRDGEAGMKMWIRFATEWRFLVRRMPDGDPVKAAICREGGR
jgi:hypothetical protein